MLICHQTCKAKFLNLPLLGPARFVRYIVQNIASNSNIIIKFTCCSSNGCLCSFCSSLDVNLLVCLLFTHYDDTFHYFLCIVCVFSELYTVYVLVHPTLHLKTRLSSYLLVLAHLLLT